MITVASNEARRILKLTEDIRNRFTNMVGSTGMDFGDITLEVEEIEKSAGVIIVTQEEVPA